MAEACASRTHRRRGDPPPDGFEDRGSHRTACASAIDDPYSSSIGVVHGLAGSIRAGEIEVFRHASLLAFGIRKGKELGRVLPQRLKPLSFAMLFARLKPCASTSGFPRRAFRGGLSAAVHAARAFSPWGSRGWLNPVLPRRASQRPRTTGQHATGDAAVCVLGNQGGFEC